MSNWQTPKTTWGQPGQTVPGVADFNRIEENIRILGEYNRAPGYGTATGTNAKTITLDPAPTSYYDGLCFAFKNQTPNTGPVTINVNGLGARPIKKPNGNDLASGALRADSIYTIRYNSNTGNFILQGEGGEYGTAQPEHVLKGYTIGTDEGLKEGTMPSIGQQIITPGTTSKSISKGYHNGYGYVQGSANLKPENIKSGVDIFGVIGSMPQGSRVATGHATPTEGAGDPDEDYVINVSGLSFKPSIVITKDFRDTIYGRKITLYVASSVWDGPTLCVKCDYYNNAADSYRSSSANVSMFSGGFRIPAYTGNPVYWIAIE